MKKFTALTLALVMVLSLGVTALAAEDTRIAYANTQTVTIDGKPVELKAYALRDENGGETNYVKLRDIAFVLNGTEAQFEVDYDGGINLVTGSPYTPNGSEMDTPFSGDRRYTASTATTYVNGSVSNLEAITLTDGKGGAYTYYKLRDLGAALDFIVDWTAERGIFIETTKPQIESLALTQRCEIFPDGQSTCFNSIDPITGKRYEPKLNVEIKPDRPAFDLRNAIVGKDTEGHTMYKPTYTDEELTERYGITIKNGVPISYNHLPDYESYHNETGNMMYHDEYGLSWVGRTCPCGDAVGWKCIGDSGKLAEVPMKCTVMDGTARTWCLGRENTSWFLEWQSNPIDFNDRVNGTDEELTERFGIAFENGIPTNLDYLPDAKAFYDETGETYYHDEYGLMWQGHSCWCGEARGWQLYNTTDYMLDSRKRQDESEIQKKRRADYFETEIALIELCEAYRAAHN